MIIDGGPVRIIPPVASPLSLAELRTHLRMAEDDHDQDAQIIANLRAATEYVENYTGLGLINQTWKQPFSAFPDRMVLRRRPVRQIVAVEHLDADGVLQPVTSSVYSVAGIGSDRWPATIRLGAGQIWPLAHDADESVVVTYQVGFGDTHNDVPEQIRQAIMLLVAYHFGQRETATFDDQRVGRVREEVPFGTHALLDYWRPLAVA